MPYAVPNSLSLLVSCCLRHELSTAPANMSAGVVIDSYPSGTGSPNEPTLGCLGLRICSQQLNHW